MYTGLYVLWNLYVLAVMLLYAPSHKLYYGSASEGIPLNSEVSSISASRTDSIQTITHHQTSSTADFITPFTQEKHQID